MFILSDLSVSLSLFLVPFYSLLLYFAGSSCDFLAFCVTFLTLVIVLIAFACAFIISLSVVCAWSVFSFSLF